MRKICIILQDLVYLEHWLARLEKLFPTQEDFNAAVIKFIDHKKEEVKTQSEFETMFTKMHKQLSGLFLFLFCCIAPMFFYEYLDISVLQQIQYKKDLFLKSLNYWVSLQRAWQILVIRSSYNI